MPNVTIVTRDGDGRPKPHDLPEGITVGRVIEQMIKDKPEDCIIHLNGQKVFPGYVMQGDDELLVSRGDGQPVTPVSSATGFACGGPSLDTVLQEGDRINHSKKNVGGGLAV